MSKLSGKIFPDSWKNFSVQLEKFFRTVGVKVKVIFFFPSRKVSGKKFEQFCCPQKSPEQSRKCTQIFFSYFCSELKKGFWPDDHKSNLMYHCIVSNVCTNSTTRPTWDPLICKLVGVQGGRQAQWKASTCYDVLQ